MTFHVYTQDGYKTEFDDRTKYRVRPNGVLETTDIGTTLWSPNYWLKVEPVAGHEESEA
ncbi:hypothetical protein [Mycobacteroides abscessus]|uniref:hypothetical protein n=1 Tax=Mycobacteroides abscessus TaxID=36809 RepID=UPI001300071D|nr:hypothetical protein [Mycobacteroides abscessus]MBE5462048.1 hypothetical protein [Mycobacteroides abscessus]QOF42829.1 hypothetical protein E3G69_001870 [Mycobacteroides abscessus]QOF47527.1 hypothetical protein E3G70_001868 [Mycobacteroides abscessus]